ncbi:hypothetical protein DSO57_1016769 [Entomophthora muscae]|uniref:Uncharacterized protein n=1 Tax=Entomophthora muscae TaxID=34485 RepID=A0ACC2T4M6_9FUNG|nr:hypothetical protein DSO57_1016769 [Entomophthora muscae]
MIPYYFLPDIFKYLELHDQRQLHLISKEWNGFLLPFVFQRLSTRMYEGFEELLRKYSEFVEELHMDSLDASMNDLLSACKITSRLFINFYHISPEAALLLGEKFPRLSYLELYYADSAKVNYLSPLTRKVQTLYYRPEPCDDIEEFMIYYKDFDCPLVTHLIIDEEWALAGHDFSYIIKRFPALKTFDYTGPFLRGYLFDHFFYDVENMVFKEISFSDRDADISAFLRFRDDIPSKTPLLSSDQEVTHESQFNDLFNISTLKLLELIPRFTCLDAIDINTRFLDPDQEYIELLLSLKDIRSLSFDFDDQDFSTDLFEETFKATNVSLEITESKLPLILEWLASCFPDLEELGIHLSDLPANYDETRESKLTFELWEKLIVFVPIFQKSTYPMTFLLDAKSKGNTHIFYLTISANQDITKNNKILLKLKSN